MTKYNQQSQSSEPRNQLGAELSLDSSKEQNKAEEIYVIAITNGTT